MIVGVWQAGIALREKQDLDEPTVLVAMRQMRQVWENLFPIEQSGIMRLLIERVQLHEDGLDIIWRDDSWQRFRRELRARLFVEKVNCSPATLEPSSLVIRCRSMATGWPLEVQLPGEHVFS